MTKIAVGFLDDEIVELAGVRRSVSASTVKTWRCWLSSAAGRDLDRFDAERRLSCSSRCSTKRRRAGRDCSETRAWKYSGLAE